MVAPFFVAVVEHRLLSMWPSGVATHGFSSCGSPA